jgi:predicted transcriptional regulator
MKDMIDTNVRPGQVLCWENKICKDYVHLIETRQHTYLIEFKNGARYDCPKDEKSLRELRPMEEILLEQNKLY